MPEAIWHIDDITFAFGEATAERVGAYSTLFADSESSSRGGLGETRRVRAAAGDVLACKVMLLPDQALFSSKDAYDEEVAHRTRAFREEYDALCRLSSFKGFVKAHAYGRMGDAPVILMEWVEGVSLADVLAARGALPALVAARLGRDLFHLLARLEWQAELFVHRDISPANVMVRTGDTSFDDQLAAGSFDLCLIDFGSATTLREGDGAFTVSTRILRGATPAYAAPEMLSIDLPNLAELRRSPKIDVYAACSVLYALLCGHAPFDLGSGSQARSDYVVKMTRDPLPAGFDAGTPEALLADIACSGIRPSQDERPSAYALFKALEHYCAHYVENMRRFGVGEDPVVLDVRVIDHPRPGVDQVALSNPLSHKPSPASVKSVSGTQVNRQAPAKSTPARKAPKAIGALLAVIAALAVGVAIVFASGVLNALPIGSRAPDDGASLSSAPSQEVESPLVGAWSGVLVSTSNSPACNGGRQNPIRLTVTKVDGDDLTFDTTVVYHGHNRQTQSTDASSNAGDAVQEHKGLTATLANGVFSAKIDESATMGRDSSLALNCKLSEDESKMTVEAVSLFKGAKTVDVYELERG